MWCAGALSLGACGEVGGGRQPGAGSGIDLDEPTEGMDSDGLDDDGVKLDMGADDGLPTDPSGEDCVAEVQDANAQSIPIDVVLVVDTSGSMGEAVAAVEGSINSDFAAILEQSNIDYRVVVLARYGAGGGNGGICIEAPLSGTDCIDPPSLPAVTERYQHYDQQTGSGALLSNIVNRFSQPDPHALAPAGYQSLLRPDSRKVFLAMTDGNSASDQSADGDAFDAELLSMPASPFGSPGDRQYVFHTIITMPTNVPATEPWLPDDPVDGHGGSIQRVSVLSGGWRFPLSQVQDFDVVFQQIAQEVVTSTPISCEFPIPAAPPGETIDPNTVEIDFFPDGQDVPTAFQQVTGAAECLPNAFYIEAETVVLCPAACDIVQSDLDASLEVRYGCDVGFDPAG